MAALIALGMSGLIMAAAPTPITTATPVFDCTVDAVLELLHSPTPAEEKPFLRTDSPGFVFDSASGLLRWKTASGGFKNPERFDIIQRGGTVISDWVASKSLSPIISSRVDDVSRFLRIRPWADAPTPDSASHQNRFYMIQYSQVWVGHCRPN
jgi:hypothetical protein